MDKLYAQHAFEFSQNHLRDTQSKIYQNLGESQKLGAIARLVAQLKGN